jgi:DNA-binding response OmpR family regulator
MPTILVIEDEESIAEPMVENLEFEGYEVLDARDGNRGLELALSGRAVLVFSI